ncbi:MAG: hypothetical protein ACK40X_07680, partial [Armatimonadota bacterium]
MRTEVAAEPVFSARLKCDLRANVKKNFRRCGLMSRKVKLGFIGAGSITGMHLRNLKDVKEA